MSEEEKFDKEHHSQFLKQLEQEKKQAKEGKMLDNDMKEEEEDDEDDFNEMADHIDELNAVQDGVGSLNMNPSSLNSMGAIKVTQQFKVPDTKTMGGMPKPPSVPGAASKINSKYEPSEWTEFFDSKEMFDDKIPIYSAGT